MCVMQYAHCHNYSKWCLTRLLRKEHAQKTELIVTRYPPDIVLNKGSDKEFLHIISGWQEITRVHITFGRMYAGKQRSKK